MGIYRRGLVRNQIEFYEAKLSHETDSWDLSEAMKNGDPVVVVDARSQEAMKLNTYLHR